MKSVLLHLFEYKPYFTVVASVSANTKGFSGSENPYRFAFIHHSAILEKTRRATPTCSSSLLVPPLSPATDA